MKKNTAKNTKALLNDGSMPVARRKPPRPNIRDLHNFGVQVLNGDDIPSEPERTLIVVGVARGGTTMVASVLRALGVHMGDKLSSVVEDLEVSRPMEAHDLPALREIVSRRNQAHAVWGFKRPGAVSYAHRYESELRNPEYVVVFRDPLAIANRNQLSVKQELLSGLADAARRTTELVEFIGSLRRRTLLLSYEKALLEPEHMVEAVARFVGNSDHKAQQQALRTIRPGNKEYLEQSRSHRSHGRLEKIDGRQVCGWAMIHGASVPVEVEVRVNKKSVLTVTASRPRPDLKKRGVHATGACGFVAELPESLALNPGDAVSVRVVSDFKQLRNSPLHVPGIAKVA